MPRLASQLILTGPPGVGKTTLARHIERLTKQPSIDLDEVISRATQSTPGALITSHGEPAFRRREVEALATVPAHGALSLGGGTLTFRPARHGARLRGLTIGLHASLPTLLARAHGLDRPLLREVGMESLLEKRRGTYLATDRAVSTEGDVEAVAATLIEARERHRVLVSTLEGHDTRIIVGSSLCHAMAGAVFHLEPKRSVLLIEDAGVPFERRAELHRALSGLSVTCIEVPGGEVVKTWSVLGNSLETAIRAGCGRQSVVVGLGGGATCDLAGMVAALLGRGAPLVLIPSTLLAMADASVGGKCAVNSSEGRNLIGTFHPADEVIVDLDLLHSLPPRELRCGMAEILKMAAICDAALFARLATPDLEAISTALLRKCEIVESDPREQHRRKLLNFGHTLAHALESASAFSLKHGEAVAVGMTAAVRFSQAKGWCSEDTTKSLTQAIERLGLPTSTPEALRNASAGLLARDKKADASEIDFIGLRAVGSAEIFRIPVQELFALPGFAS